MPIREYRELDLEVEKPTFAAERLRGLTVRLLDARPGADKAVRRTLSAGQAGKLEAWLAALESPPIDTDQVIDLGTTLANLLFPPAIRAVLSERLDDLATDEGLRIRLRLDPRLADLPWEYAWVARQSKQRDSSGFLALDPRVSIVRHEAVAGRLDPDTTVRDRRVVAVLDDPEILGRPSLNLATERANIESALKDVPGISVDVFEDVTVQGLEDALRDGVDVFHFAGHGVDDSLVLVDDSGAAWELPADQLAVNLQGRGAQLVVLGACESGMRAPRDRWSGVATRLIAADIPAVVAMQYRIGDRTAIAFSDRLYRSLAAGLSLEEAVAAGRLAIYNETTGGRGDPKRRQLWRDWGVPVLYLRPDAAVSLTSIPDEQERKRVVEKLEVTVRLRVKNVKKGGTVTGGKIGSISAGSGVKIDVGVDVDGDVEGDVVGLVIESIGGGRTPSRRSDL